MTISIDTMRSRIADTTLSYDRDSVCFHQHNHWINWVPGENSWQLLWIEGESRGWLFDTLEDCLCSVPDNAICDFYEEQIAEDYPVEEALA